MSEALAPARVVASTSPSLDGARVTLVGINFPPEPTGIAPYNAAMAAAMATAGADVTVVTGVPHYPMWRVQRPFDHGFRHVEHLDGIRVKRRRHYVPTQPGLRGRALMESTFFSHALPSVLRSKADAIIAVSPSLSGAGAAVAASRGRPLGILVQDFTGVAVEQTGAAGARVSGVIGSLERAVLRRAHRIGVIADAFVPSAQTLGFPLDRISVLPNFTHVDPVHVDPRFARQRLGLPTRGRLVVHTGNMGAKQGLRHVVDCARLAAAERQDLHFVLVGAGNQMVALQHQARGLDNVTFVPPLSNDDYPYALAAADVLLLCEEQGVREFCLPSKLTSYVVADRPIVAAVEPRGLTANEVNAYGSASVVPPGRPHDLLARLLEVLDDEAQSRRLLIAASAHARASRAEHAMARYVQFADDLLAGR